MFVMILLVPANQNIKTTVSKTVSKTLKNGCELSYKGILLRMDYRSVSVTHWQSELHFKCKIEYAEEF
jgi:hypothetical protein